MARAGETLRWRALNEGAFSAEAAKEMLAAEDERAAERVRLLAKDMRITVEE